MGKQKIILYNNIFQASISLPEKVTLEKNTEGFIVASDVFVGYLYYDELLTKKAGTYTFKSDYIQNMNKKNALEILVINLKNSKGEYGTAWFTMPSQEIGPGMFYKVGDILELRSFSSTGTFKFKQVKIIKEILPDGLSKNTLTF
jgi:hypothetical protein